MKLLVSIFALGFFNLAAQAEEFTKQFNGRLFAEICRESVQVPEGSYCDQNCRATRVFNNAHCSTRPAGSCAVIYYFTDESYSSMKGVGIAFSGQTFTSGLRLPKFQTARGIGISDLNFDGRHGTLYSRGELIENARRFIYGRPVRVDLNLDHDVNGNEFTKYRCNL